MASGRLDGLGTCFGSNTVMVPFTWRAKPNVIPPPGPHTPATSPRLLIAVGTVPSTNPNPGNVGNRAFMVCWHVVGSKQSEPSITNVRSVCRRYPDCRSEALVLGP